MAFFVKRSVVGKAFFVKRSVVFLLPILLICASHANDHLSQVREGDRKLLGLVTIVGKELGKVVEAESGPLEKLTEIAVKKIGETVVGKLFGSDGKRGFQIGWKTGKLFLSVEDRCQNYTNYFNCTVCTASPPCVTCEDPTLPTCLVMNCVVQVTEVTGLVNWCSENCGVPQETPCTFFNGTISFGTSVIPIENVNSTCSIN